MKLRDLAMLLVVSLAFPAGASDLGRVVTGLYKDYAWSAVFGAELSSKMKSINTEDEKVLRKYFSAPLAKAIADDSRCTAKSGELCKLDYDILFDSQDPAISDLNVVDCGKECVKVCFQERDKKKCITIAGRGEKGAARITDLVYEDGRSLRKSLGLNK